MSVDGLHEIQLTLCGRQGTRLDRELPALGDIASMDPGSRKAEHLPALYRTLVLESLSNWGIAAVYCFVAISIRAMLNRMVGSSGARSTAWR